MVWSLGFAHSDLWTENGCMARGFLYIRYYFTLKSCVMLKWSFIFLIIAVVAGIFGFTGVEEGAASIAKILFFIFISVWIIMLVLGMTIFKKATE